MEEKAKGMKKGMMTEAHKQAIREGQKRRWAKKLEEKRAETQPEKKGLIDKIFG